MITFTHIQRLLKPYIPTAKETNRNWMRPIVEKMLAENGHVTGPELAQVTGVTPESSNRYLRTFRDEGWLRCELVSVQHKSAKGYTTTSRVAVYRVYEK